jgi:hypothetical protein
MSTQVAKGLCGRHYQQKRRGNLGKTRQHPAQLTSFIGLRVPSELPSHAAQLALLRGESYRAVLREALARGLLEMSREVEP